MREIGADIVNRLLEWEERLESGDHSLDEWATSVLMSGERYDEDPIIFVAPSRATAVQIAIEAGVDFTQRRPDGETVLFENDFYDTNTYRKVADVFSLKGAIDWAEKEGLTALSAQVKFGELENARTLLERGASPNSFATIAQYGNARLTIAKQAVNVLPDEACENIDDLSIKLLSLLKEFGLYLSRDEMSELIERAEKRPKLKSWMENNI